MTTELDKFLAERQNRQFYEQERLVLEITEAVYGLMNEQGVSQAELAQELGCSPSNVSQMLDGTNNFTVRKVADLLFALDARLSIATEPLTQQSIVEVHAEYRPRVSADEYLADRPSTSRSSSPLAA